MGRKVTARASANIALVKYWGKRDVKLNLPETDSLSLTLEGLQTETTISEHPDGHDALILDGKPAHNKELKKVLPVLSRIRELSSNNAPVLIDSHNHFPTGAGLASSASGLAALSLAAACFYELDIPRSALSAIARQGSGSASRSLFGGFARWHRGLLDDGSDSIAESIFPAHHWPLGVAVAVLRAGRKEKSSTEGMHHTKASSPYHKAWVEEHPKDMKDAIAAIHNKQFTELAQVAERSCLRMHADMLSADPALLYLLPESFAVFQKVWQWRADGLPVFFSADAGPNVKVFCPHEHLDEVIAKLQKLDFIQQVLPARGGEGATSEVLRP